MKFELSMAKSFLSDDEKEKYEKLGFKLVKTGYSWQIEDNPFIEIKSLKELMDFIKEHGEIVLSKDRIIIYNDYLE